MVHERSNKGFTLIELLLVITLLGLLTGFLVPQMIDFNRRQVLRNEVVGLSDTLKQAQNFAESGVQGESTFISSYQFKFTQQAGDPPQAYRGYQITRTDSGGTQVGDVFYFSALQCPVCINTGTSTINFSVPQGTVTGLSASPDNYQVCYPGQGHYQVSVEKNGRIYTSDLIKSSCTCAVNACN